MAFDAGTLVTGSRDLNGGTVLLELLLPRWRGRNNGDHVRSICHCISYFSVVMKHHDQGNLWKKEFGLAYLPEGSESIPVGKRGSLGQAW